MKITVERISDQNGDLTFIISAKELHQLELDQNKLYILKLLDNCYKEIEIRNLDDTLKIECLIHQAKEELFTQLKDSMTFSIRHQLEPKYNYICQEIYNNIYDTQNNDVKEWMTTFDPQRTKYYFDNDRKLENDEYDI